MRRRPRVTFSSNIAFNIIASILTIAILILTLNLIFTKPLAPKPDGIEDIADLSDVSSLNPHYKSILIRSIPMLARGEDLKGTGILSGFLRLVFPNFADPKGIVSQQIPYLSNLDGGGSHAVEAVSNLPDRALIDRYEREEVNYGEVSDEIKIIIDGLEPDNKPIDMKGKGAQVLIYHTHSREAYKQDPVNPYKEVAREAFRSNDFNHTVVDVGRVFTDHLISMGIPTIHDTTDHEGNDYNASYSKSLKTLEKRIKDHDSLQVFIDIHRNSYGKDSRKNPDDEVVIINGERVAKLFVVIGSGEGVVGGFNSKPDWQENAKFAMTLTNRINELYPGLAKDVYYKRGRYNQHVSTKAILIEVGSTYTTQKEAERATKYLAEALSQIFE